MEPTNGRMLHQQDEGHRITRWHLAGLLAMFLFLTAVREWMLWHSEIIARDGMVYTAMAQQWTSHPMQVIRQYDHHAGYPVAIVGMHRLLAVAGLADRPDAWDLAGGLVSLAASAAALVGLWWWAVKAYDRRVAIAAVLLAGVGRKWAALGAEVLSDALAIAFQVWSLVLVHSMLQRLSSRRRSAVLLAAGAGLCGGLGYLVRPESLLIPAVGVVAAAGFQIRRRLRWRLSLASIAALAGAAAIVALPYMIAIGGLSKKKDLLELIEDVVFSCTQAMPMASVAAASLSDWFAQKYINQIFEAMHPAVAFVVVAWAVAAVWQRIRPTPALEQAKLPSSTAGWLMVLYAVPMMFILLGLRRAHSYLSHRHVMMTALLLTPLGGQGLFVLAGLVRWLAWRGRQRVPSLSAVAAVLTAVFAAGILAHNLAYPPHHGKGVYRRAALDLARQTPADAVVMADSKWVPYYVAQVDPQRQVVVEPDLELPAAHLRRQAELRHASYVVLPTGKPSHLTPTDAALAAEGLVLWRQYTASDKKVLRVYRVAQAEVGS